MDSISTLTHGCATLHRGLFSFAPFREHGELFSSETVVSLPGRCISGAWRPTIWFMERLILDGQALTLAEIEAVSVACCEGAVSPCRIETGGRKPRAN